MSTQPPPPGQGPSPDDDPFSKPQQPPAGSGGGSPYDAPPPPPGGGSYNYPPPPPGGGNPYGGGPQPPYGGDPYGGGYGGTDPLAGMPPLADSGRRVLARLVDMVIVGVVVGLISWAAGWNDVDTDNLQYGSTFGSSLVAAVLYMAYDIYFTSRTGQTLGKQLMKLRTANLSDGGTPGVQTALTRAAVLWLPFAFCCACVWTAICGGWSFFDKPYKQGLHDKAAKTVVVTTG